MADSRSLMVRLGMTTTFWPTTLVTPSFVTVFMGKPREKKRVWGLWRTLAKKQRRKISGGGRPCALYQVSS